ncbi:MAG: DUF4252 domain-containing protein [Bacteroidota bacterium]|nr:DUF4252 domain-containing protein [Bacteroidota bacterium]
MKKILGVLFLSASMSLVYGQRSIDALFNKYSDSQGFVSLTINGNLLKLFRSCDNNMNKDRWMAKVTEIRILAQEDENMKTENFYDAVMKDLNLKDYEEFMRVKDSDEDLRMLVRSDGNVIREFLLIGGGEDNLIIQVKGQMNINDAKEFSSDVREDHHLDSLTDLN